MVQVDVFWAYGFGASLAVAAGSQLAKAAKATLKEKLREFCGQNLKRELRPMEWVFYPADHVLPRTLSGKIDKKQLS